MQNPEAMPPFLNKPHKAEASAFYTPPLENEEAKKYILSQLEITDEDEDELYGHRRQFVVKIHHIARQEYSFHNRRNLKWLPWGKYHKYRLAHVHMTRKISHKLMVAIKKKFPAFRVRLAADAWKHFYHGYAEIYETLNARFAISRTLLGARFPRVYVYLRNKWSKSFYISLEQVLLLLLS
jgi:hypothetical protein